MRSISDPKHEAFGLRAWAGEFGSMLQAHRHNELELNYVLHGRATYLISGSVVTLPPRRLCVLWGAVPHQTLDAPGGGGANAAARSEAMWVTVPLARVLAWDLPALLTRRLFRAGCAIERAEQSGDAELFRRWIADLEDSGGGDQRAMLLELEARLRRMAGRLGRRAGQPRGARAPASEIPPVVERLARFLAAHYRQPVTVEDAARAAHVHAHHAMTLFRRHTGLTLHQYLTTQRVAHAQRLLATTQASVLDVALESGFASLSRFYAAFKAQTGSPPRGFRQQFPASADASARRG